MKPAWDKLGALYNGSPNVLIADVDCTTDDGKPVCESNSVKGFPTIMYFNQSSGKEGAKYEGGRDFKTFKKFVKKTLKGIERACDVTTKKDCLPEEVSYLDKWATKGTADIEKESSRLAKKLDEVLKSDQRKQVDFEAKMMALLKKGKKGKAEL